MRLDRGCFFGSTVGSQELPGIVMTETVYEPRAIVPEHRHARAYFCFVLNGDFAESASGGTRHCGPGRAVYHPPEEPHADRFGRQGGRCFNVEFDAEGPSIGMDRLSVSAPPRVFRSRAVEDALRDLHRECSEPDDLTALAAQGLVAILVASASREFERSMPRPPWVDYVVDLLNDRCAESLTLEGIAGTLGIHPVHMARAFRRHTGETIHETIRRLRVARARDLLLRTDEPIARIAHAVGFCDHSHLTRTFRRLTGTTPSRYRRDRGR